MKKKKLISNILFIVSILATVAAVVIFVIYIINKPKEDLVDRTQEQEFTKEVTDLNVRISELSNTVNMSEDDFTTTETDVTELIDLADDEGTVAQQVNSRYVLYRLYAGTNREAKGAEILENLLKRNDLNPYDRFGFLELLIDYYGRINDKSNLKKALERLVVMPDDMFPEMTKYDGDPMTKETYKKMLEAL